MLPFCCLDEYGFTKYVSHAKMHYAAQYQSKRARQSKIKCLRNESENTPSSLCEYLDPQQVRDVVNEDCLNDLTVYHSNVCSLRKNLDKLFETFQDGLKLPDLIGVTETRLDEHLTEIDIDNYDFEPCFSNTQAGGVGIYVANYLEYAVRRDLSLNLPHCEDIWVEIFSSSRKSRTKFEDGKNMVVGIVYRHPGSQYKTFCERICNTIDDMNRCNKNFIIMGDVNVNSLKYNTVGTVTDYLQSIEGAGCLSFIDKATRVVKRGNRWETSCIDHLYSNIEPARMKTYVVTSDISDHFSTLAKILDVNAIN